MSVDLSRKIQQSQEFLADFRTSSTSRGHISYVDIKSLMLDISKSQEELRRLLKPVDKLPGKLEKIARILPCRERLLLLRLFNFWRSRFSGNLHSVYSSLTTQLVQMEGLINMTVNR